MFAACQQQRVDKPFARNQYAFSTLELRTNESVIEAGIVDYQRCIPNKGKELVGNLNKAFVRFEKLRGKAVNRESLSRNVALRI
jgi:hypothetical protein